MPESVSNHARSYFDWYTKRPEGASRELAQHVYRGRWELIGEAKKVLDVGFGAGGFLDAAPPGVQLVGLDSDAAAVERRPGVGVLGSAEELPFEDDEFDAIHAAHVIEHLQAPDRFVAECARVLRPGGRLLVATPDIERYRFEFWVDHTHLRPFTDRSLRRLLGMHGLEVMAFQRGLFPQTRIEEALVRLGLRAGARYRIRMALGRRFGRELIMLARLT